MRKDLYEILGVDRQADGKEIKRAYRLAAKRCHPDVSSDDAQRFKELHQAYEILSNPTKRREYDRDLSDEELWPWVYQPDPSSLDRPHGLFDHVESIFSHMDRLWRPSEQDFWAERIQATEDLVLEIILTPEEAEQGQELTVHVPLWVTCHRCRGTGTAQGMICGRCRGQGRERITQEATISIPPGVTNGMKRRVRLDFPEVDEVNLVVAITVRP